MNEKVDNFNLFHLEMSQCKSIEVCEEKMVRIMQIAVFTAFLCLYAAAHYYIWLRLVRDTRLPGVWALLGKIVIVTMGLSIPLIGIGWRYLRNTGLVNLSMFMIWSIFLLYLLIILGLGDLGRFIYRFFSKKNITSLQSSAKNVEGEVETEQIDEFAKKEVVKDNARRLFVTRTMAGAAAGFTTALIGRGISNAVAGPGHNNFEIKLAKLPQKMDGFSIAQISDLHIGRGVSKKYIHQVVAGINKQKPDLIVITGDLVDGTPKKLGYLVEELAALRSRHGIYFVPGNHDYYSGYNRWMTFLKKNGIEVLTNKHVYIKEGGEHFVLAGVDDKVGKRTGFGPDVSKALAGIAPEDEVVLLSHRPGVIFAAARHKVGLMLCGHTHGGGQMWPFTWLSHFVYPYVRGLALHEKTWIYVNRGTGWVGPPIRLDSPSEVSYFTLRKG
ncbi:MAG: metallophosphoesterase [Myxococcota bacterium]